MMTYDEVLGALTPESEDLFCRMVEMHLAAEGVAGTTRMFLLASTFSGTFLKFTAGARFAVDESALRRSRSERRRSSTVRDSLAGFRASPLPFEKRAGCSTPTDSQMTRPLRSVTTFEAR